jgi:hypothetical protein
MTQMEKWFLSYKQGFKKEVPENRKFPKSWLDIWGAYFQHG